MLGLEGIGKKVLTKVATRVGNATPKDFPTRIATQVVESFITRYTVGLEIEQEVNLQSIRGRPI